MMELGDNLFFTCHAARPCWLTLDMAGVLQEVAPLEPRWWLNCYKKLHGLHSSSFPFTKLICGIWVMWKFRNGVKFKAHEKSIHKLIYLINKEIKNVCQAFGIDHHEDKQYTWVEVIWLLPPNGFMMIYFDGVFMHMHKASGIIWWPEVTKKLSYGQFVCLPY